MGGPLSSTEETPMWQNAISFAISLVLEAWMDLTIWLWFG
jgi:hypothetical protein